ncbi:universal stress protein [Arthrobacter sp. BF1]|uniref:universal stress protein n=1 Tax=Arthrobacter sp. BF1 TaxID=2821145 RepID=UPI001C4F1F4F|nr:universal stress protein [Arthrobacter sp. BF1]
MTTEQSPVTIIVGVDGSDSSIEALREAVWLAKALGAQVKALTCWNYPSAYTLPYALGDFGFKEAAQKILDGAVESAFGLDWPRNLTTQLVQGSARPTLIEASRNADLLVLGRRGMGGFKGLLLGSVSAACTAHAHCPVVIVHAPKLGEHHA